MEKRFRKINIEYKDYRWFDMTINGKQIRLRRISDKRTGRFVIVPMDHGVTAGPIKGVRNIEDSINKVGDGGATAVVVHKGMAGIGLQKFGGDLGMILHLSASTKIGLDPDEKVLVASVEEALQMGADAVSMQINVGALAEGEMLNDFGEISHECRTWQVPLLAMMYLRGPDIKDPFDVEQVKHVVRLGAELGADIIKTNYTGNPETFKEVTGACPVPVIIAGGPQMSSEREVLEMVKDAMHAGAAGVSIGRNVFQHDNITGMTKAIARIVIDDIGIDEAYNAIIGK